MSRTVQDSCAPTLLIAVAVLHVVAFPDHVKIAPYIGVSFLLNAGAASVLAAAILSGRAWGWSLGSLLAAVTAVLYVAARTIGLPGYHEADWIDPVGLFPVGLASFMVEALVVIAFLLVARRQTRDRRLVRPEPSP